MSSFYFRVSINEQNEPQARHGESVRRRTGWRRRTQSANGSSQSPRGYPDGEGSVEGSHTDRAQGLYWLDRLSQTTGDTQTQDRESLLDACGRKATPCCYSIVSLDLTWRSRLPQWQRLSGA